MKADLHTHTNLSDGHHSPDFLLQRAAENGVTHLAITDHDCTAALGKISLTEESPSLISGVEISSNWKGLEIHVIGLCFDPAYSAMTELLEKQQEMRRERAYAIANKLDGKQMELIDFLMNLPCISLTRSHIADFLVSEGVVPDRQRAFKRYLGKGGKCYVEPHWCELPDAIKTINSCQGIAVLAHPNRYGLTRTKLRRLIADFAEADGSAIEVSYSQLDNFEQKNLRELADSHQLYYSMGSDFHTDEAHWTDIGKFPEINFKHKKNAIWHHPRWRSL